MKKKKRSPRKVPQQDVELDFGALGIHGLKRQAVFVFVFFK